MKINKNLMAAVAVTTIATGSIIGISATSALSDTSKADRSAALAEKLGVDQSAVETALGEMHSEREAERDAAQAERLAGFVTDGTLTQDQADALTAKRAELEATREALKDSGATREEIRTQMKESKDSFNAWATEQGIDLATIRPKDGEGRGNRGHGGGMDNHMDDDSKTQAQ